VLPTQKPTGHQPEAWGRAGGSPRRKKEMAWQATNLFYAISLRSVNGKACGSKEKENSKKLRSKDIAACHRTKAAKRLRHKNTAPTHRTPLFYSVSFWPALMPQGLVAKQFLLHFIF
jgi:hypothetical protein